MTQRQLKWVFIGLSITSSWGNGHATTFRALIRSLTRRGHQVQFLERNETWYAQNRDLPEPDFCDLFLYDELEQLQREHEESVGTADVVIVGSYVRQGVEVGDWVRTRARGVVAFYDIDTPVTLAKLERGDFEYLEPRQIKQYDLYLSFSGCKALEVLHLDYGSPCARALYCSVDPRLYNYQEQPATWDLGYLGTYSPDRQPGLDLLLLRAAQEWPGGRFVVAGPQYPAELAWPSNVDRIEHLPPGEHCDFYNGQRFTLNITRDDMKAMGHSPSVRLFEAAACGTPIISDNWPGLNDLFEPETEILVSDSPEQTLRYLQEMPEAVRIEIGSRARKKVLEAHTADHRAAELESYVDEVLASRLARVKARADAPAPSAVLEQVV